MPHLSVRPCVCMCLCVGRWVCMCGPENRYYSSENPINTLAKFIFFNSSSFSHQLIVLFATSKLFISSEPILTLKYCWISLVHFVPIHKSLYNIFIILLCNIQMNSLCHESRCLLLQCLTYTAYGVNLF